MTDHGQEEDFVTNTYQRKLLDDIDREAIRELLQEARVLLSKHGHEIADNVATALDLRLELRYAFLRAIELSELRSSPGSLKTPWLQLLSILEPINASHALGVPVPDAFTTKIQRRLASTMPPRPIVQVSFEDAYLNFKRLFTDGMEVGEVLTFHDSQSLLVGLSRPLVCVA
jgi:N-alpha-acetyltransferase 35, NatC auxiliary subunit